MPKLPFTGILLAGGKSSRMGRDKALLPFGEKTSLEFLAGLLTAVFQETLIIVEDKMKCEKLNLGAALVYEDIFKGKGPLAGLYTGLTYSSGMASCVLTCDMPFVDEALVRQFVDFWEEENDAMCLEDPQGRLQPFPAIYRRSSRHLMHLLLEQGERSMRRFLEVAAVKLLVLQQEKIKVLTNMNTLEDYYQVLKEKKEWVNPAPRAPRNEE